MLSADEALVQLRDGNRRYVEEPSLESWVLHAFEPSKLAGGQAPFAAVLGCADSRVPVEILFQQGPGSVFVVRVAGTAVGAEVLGSLEYAVDVLGSRLVVVLGHTRCGAVDAALQAARGGPPASPHLRAITDGLLDHIGTLPAGLSPDALLDRAVEANTRAAAVALGRRSEVLRRHAARDVRIVGAVYELETGTVRFLDD